MGLIYLSLLHNYRGSGGRGRSSALAGLPEPEPAASDREPHQPVDSQGQHAEEQVAGDLEVPPHPDMASSVGILQGGVHPLDVRPLPVAHAVVADLARPALGERLPREARLQRRVPAGVGVDDRHPSRQLGVDADLPRVVGGVHQLVAVVDPLGSHRRQRDRRLAVVPRRRGEDTAHRDVPVGGVSMHFVATPALPGPLRVALRAHVAGLRQRGHHLRRGQAAPELPFQTGGLPDQPLAFPRAAPPPLPLRLRLRRGPLPSHDRRRIPGYVADDRAVIGGPHQRPVHPLGEPGLREPREGAGERRLARHLRHAAPAAKPPQRRVVKPPVDQGPRGREVPDRLGHERARPGIPVGGRGPDAAVVVREMPLHRGQVQHRHEPAVRLPQRTHLLGQEQEREWFSSGGLVNFQPVENAWFFES